MDYAYQINKMLSYINIISCKKTKIDDNIDNYELNYKMCDLDIKIIEKIYNNAYKFGTIKKVILDSKVYVNDIEVKYVNFEYDKTIDGFLFNNVNDYKKVINFTNYLYNNTKYNDYLYNIFKTKIVDQDFYDYLPFDIYKMIFNLANNIIYDNKFNKLFINA